jgi:hypothetical protein
MSRVKLVNCAGIAAPDWILTPGRYVGRSADRHGVVPLEDVQLDATAPDDFEWKSRPNPVTGSPEGQASPCHSDTTPPGETVDQSAVGVPRPWAEGSHPTGTPDRTLGH